MSDAVPREQLSAWQRWELASLDARPGAGATAADIEAARAEGYAAGYEQGRSEGRTAGHAAAKKDVARLSALLEGLAQSIGEHEQAVADAVLDFALALAHQMAGTAFAVRPDLVLPVVADALQRLPPASQRIVMTLNPADLELVRAFLGADPSSARVQFAADPSESRGGCRLETEQAVVDASAATRWRRLLTAVGRNHEWIDGD
jgi:flagellar assembly protein FliH